MAVHLVLCFRAQAPKKDSIEWISMYEKPQFSLFEENKALCGNDALMAFLAALVQMASFAAFLFLPLLLEGKDIVAEVNWSSAASIFLAAGGSGVFLYLLCKLLTHDRSAAMLCTLVMAGDIFREPMAAMFLLGLMLCLYLWLRRSEGTLGLDHLCLAACAMAACAAFYPMCSLLLPVVLMTMLFDGIWRARKSLTPWWHLPVQILVTALIFLLLLSVRCAALFPLNFAEAVKNGAFFKAVLLHLQGWLYVVTPNAGTLLALTVQLPSVIYAVGSIVFLLWAAVAKKDAAALFVLVWNVALMAFSLLTATSFYVLPAALACGYIAARCFQRDAIATGVCGIAVTAALTYAITIFIYF